MDITIAARADGTLSMTRPGSAEELPLPHIWDSFQPTPWRYLTANENTLCYRQPGTAMLGVIFGNLKGHDWRNGAFFPGRLDALRLATPDDFRRLRVVQPPDYAELESTS